MYDVPTVAHVLNCSESTVRRLISAGRLGAVTVGPRSTRVPAAALAAFVAPYVLPSPDLKARAAVTAAERLVGAA